MLRYCETYYIKFILSHYHIKMCNDAQIIHNVDVYQIINRFLKICIYFH